MTRRGGFRSACALGLLLLAPSLAPAAWNNVFQVTCHGCRRPTTSAFAPARCPTCTPPCAPQVAFVQRSFYQPVTSFEPVTTMVPVTSNFTSFFWEPVTSYSYSSYYDPCSGCCQSVATPTTSFRLRSKCNSVTNYVARISFRPVTTLRQSCYMEAVPVNPCCPTAVAAAQAPTGTVPPLNLSPEPPALGEQRTLPNTGGAAPGLSEDRSYYGGTMPPLTGQSQRQPPRAPAFAPVPAPAPAVPTKPGQIASRLNSAATVNGQVVANNFAPQGGAKVVFVSAQKQHVRQAAQADDSGRFQVNLPAGGWYVYLTGADGQATYHSQFTVLASESRNVTVVSR